MKLKTKDWEDYYLRLIEVLDETDIIPTHLVNQPAELWPKERESILHAYELVDGYYAHMKIEVLRIKLESMIKSIHQLQEYAGAITQILQQKFGNT